ncbi:14-3-3 protein [Thelephora ganbajun]|uniref:14-3-3 protein n=1 Tax=Thelephora ganbajun TaxID=370292 RepID=A0ACB6ZQB8_THEGA|nr:14-3-3 protein [Thelephora ganbajun]
MLVDKNCSLSVPERDSLNHTLDSCGWDLAQHIRSGSFHGTASADVNRVTGKLFRLIDFALQKARQEEVVEYKTLAGEVYEALWLASGQRSQEYKARAAAAYLGALSSANGHMDRRSEEYRHLCTNWPNTNALNDTSNATVMSTAASAFVNCPNSRPRRTPMWNTPTNLENGIDDPKDISRLYDHLHELDVTIFKLQGDVVGMHGRLTVREHCQLAVAYRRILLSHRAELQASARPGCEGVCSRASIVNEMHRLCGEFLETVSRRLLPVSKTGEEIVYCWTMVADFHRLMWTCLIDFPESSGHAKTHANASNNAYQTALSQAIKDLCPMNPVRLTVSYSFATFVRDVLNSPTKSCHIIQHAIEEAVAYAAARPHEKFSSESHKEVQKLRNKLESWRNASTSP